MLFAKKEAVMTVLSTLDFVAFSPLQNNNCKAVRPKKLIAKIDELLWFIKSRQSMSGRLPLGGDCLD